MTNKNEKCEGCGKPIKDNPTFEIDEPHFCKKCRTGLSKNIEKRVVIHNYLSEIGRNGRGDFAQKPIFIGVK